MQIKCPCCYAKYDLQTVFEDESARNLLKIMSSLDRAISYPLYVYITLFRSPKRDMSSEKELRLVREVLGLGASPAQLMSALQKVVEVMREKQVSGGFKPLKNHNYLKRVIEDTPQAPVTSSAMVSVGEHQQPHQQPQSRQLTSKTANGMAALQRMKRR